MKNVLNLSRMNSWYVMEIHIPLDVQISDVEDLLNEELPKLGAWQATFMGSKESELSD